MKIMPPSLKERFQLGLFTIPWPSYKVCKSLRCPLTLTLSLDWHDGWLDQSWYLDLTAVPSQWVSLLDDHRAGWGSVCWLYVRHSPDGRIIIIIIDHIYNAPNTLFLGTVYIITLVIGFRLTRTYCMHILHSLGSILASRHFTSAHLVMLVMVNSYALTTGFSSFFPVIILEFT